MRVAVLLLFIPVALGLPLPADANPCAEGAPEARDHRTRRILAALVPEAYVALDGELTGDDDRTVERPRFRAPSAEWEPERSVRHTLEAGFLWRPVRLVRAIADLHEEDRAELPAPNTETSCRDRIRRRRNRRLRRRFHHRLRRELSPNPQPPSFTSEPREEP